MNHKHLKILQFNIASLRLRISELRETVVGHNPDVICLSETRYMTDSQLPRITNYDGFGRRDEPNDRGVAIYVKNNIEWNQVLMDTHHFNAKHTAWGCMTDTAPGTTLLRYCEDRDRMLFAPDEPTRINPIRRHNNSTLDLFITKDVIMEDVRTYFECSSDHKPVIGRMTSRVDLPRIEPVERWRWKDANWPNYRRQLNQMEMKREFQSTEEVEEKIEKITRRIQRAMEPNIPKSMTKNRGLIIPTELQDIIKDRNKARRAFQRTRRQEFKDYGDILSEEIRVGKTEKSHRKPVAQQHQKSKRKPWKCLENAE
ncbi:uncharacterized protein, partial [Diabrotica undecimpunctata]|uniref:uncharacterized protein n=1 Tax=Diabrotica undecimpunctata TaxID=50387 RepID=UPI003B6358FA